MIERPEEVLDISGNVGLLEDRPKQAHSNVLSLVWIRDAYFLRPFRHEVVIGTASRTVPTEFPEPFDEIVPFLWPYQAV